MIKQLKKRVVSLVVLVSIVVAAALLWLHYGGKKKDEGILSGNGRIEAVEIDIAAKTAGRVTDILVREGEFVQAGQVVARMDVDVLNAQLREAKAKLQQAQSAVETARSQMTQRRSEKLAAQAVVAQREAEFGVARQHSYRSSTLAVQGATSLQEADDDRAKVESAVAAIDAAHAQVAAAHAAILTAKEQVVGATSNVEAVQATIERIRADIEDSALKAPRSGRVQYRVAQPGEVVGAGGRVLTLVDLADVYMTFFLPMATAGRIPVGTEVRLILDAIPQYVIPARVSFVSDVAQFTPKTVETANEREKLMFRIRAQVPIELLEKYILHVKTGLPGMAYVRQDSRKPWPTQLQVRLPQ